MRRLCQEWTFGEKSAVPVPQMTNGAGGGPDQPRINRGLRSGSGPMVNAPPVVLITVAVLIAIHVAILWGGHDWEIWTLYAFALIPARFQGPAAIAMIEGFGFEFATSGHKNSDFWQDVLDNAKGSICGAAGLPCDCCRRLIV